MLNIEIIRVVLDCVNMEDLVKINNVCYLFRKCFLERGGYFAIDKSVSKDYFAYLLTHDKLEIFNHCLERGFLEIDKGSLLDANKEEIKICVHDFWVGRPEEYTKPSRVGLFIMAKDVALHTCRPCKSDPHVMQEHTDTMVGIIRDLLKSEPLRLLQPVRSVQPFRLL